MKIHLAARYGRAEELRWHVDTLVRLGHEVTSRWLQRPYMPEVTNGDVLRFAMEDWADAVRADCCIAFSEIGEAFAGGEWLAEFCAALALGKRCIVIGRTENVFCLFPGVQQEGTFMGFIAQILIAEQRAAAGEAKV